ncbi:MAG: hypothetical protein M3272_02225 [Actinomycetota bacterium]|nr:hypothetical protein [Actinomycetota bacterium]
MIGFAAAEEGLGAMVVRIEKVVALVLRGAHELHVEEVMETLSEGSEGLYRCPR